MKDLTKGPDNFLYLETPLSNHPWRINFCEALKDKRYQSHIQSNKPEYLIRACKSDLKTIIDATAGMGRDALLLAAHGFTVTMIERNEILATLLKQALEELKTCAPAMAKKLKLIKGDAIAILKALSPDEYPAVIVCDPMHPERDKSALVKKELRLIRDLVGDDMDAAELITAAKKSATEKVVVKLPRLSPHLTPTPPTYTLEGKRMRYDVYQI